MEVSDIVADKTYKKSIASMAADSKSQLYVIFGRQDPVLVLDLLVDRRIRDPNKRAELLEILRSDLEVTNTMAWLKYVLITKRILERKEAFQESFIQEIEEIFRKTPLS